MATFNFLSTCEFTKNYFGIHEGLHKSSKLSVCGSLELEPINKNSVHNKKITEAVIQTKVLLGNNRDLHPASDFPDVKSMFWTGQDITNTIYYIILRQIYKKINLQ